MYGKVVWLFEGGIVFGILAGIIYAKRHKIDILEMADIVAPAIILGQAIGRCANLLNGDAFGAPTGSNFGIIYPETTLAYHTYGAQPLWPAEIWEGQLDFVIFALLLIFRAFPHAKGQAFSLYIMLYSLASWFRVFAWRLCNSCIFDFDFSTNNKFSSIYFGRSSVYLL